MYDPIILGEKIKHIVCKNNFRKYYRFRSARFYGGIATADCVGCNLSCIYCWSNKPKNSPSNFGKFYSPKQVFNKLIHIAKKKKYSLIRVSGNEPTIAKEHLLELLELVDKTDFQFILETNGILIGNDPNYAYEISKYNSIHVRISLKGCTPSHFSQLTGARSEAFDLQINALQNLVRSHVSCHVSIMKDFAKKDYLNELLNKLYKISPDLAHSLEFERLILYPHVKAELVRHGFQI
ncbi:MAG: radical SAM protein [Candidatus Helarchaeota archaeon]